MSLVSPSHSPSEPSYYHLSSALSLAPPPKVKERYLHCVVRLQKQVPAADAAVHAAQRHVEAEGEEVAMVEMAHTVVQPGWDQSY